MDEQKREKEFFQQHRKFLSSVFQERIDALVEQVLTMEPGQRRDLLIEFIKEYRDYWLVQKLGEKKKQYADEQQGNQSFI